MGDTQMIPVTMQAAYPRDFALRTGHTNMPEHCHVQKTNALKILYEQIAKDCSASHAYGACLCPEPSHRFHIQAGNAGTTQDCSGLYMELWQ